MLYDQCTSSHKIKINVNRLLICQTKEQITSYMIYPNKLMNFNYLYMLYKGVSKFDITSLNIFLYSVNTSQSVKMSSESFVESQDM